MANGFVHYDLRRHRLFARERDTWKSVVDEDPPIGPILQIRRLEREKWIYDHAWVYRITRDGPDWSACRFVPSHWRLAE